jgi:hypothetical protein
MPGEIVAERLERVGKIRRGNIPEPAINSQTVQQNDRRAGAAPVDLGLGESSWLDHRASLERENGVCRFSLPPDIAYALTADGTALTTPLGPSTPVICSSTMPLVSMPIAMTAKAAMR